VVDIGQGSSYFPTRDNSEPRLLPARCRRLEIRLARYNADVRELASGLGLGAFPYHSFRNPPVRHTPPATSPAAEVPSPGDEDTKVVAIADRGPRSARPMTTTATGPSPAPAPPAAAAAPAGPAQVIAWPAAVLQGPGASAPDLRCPPGGSASTAPVSELPQLPLVLAAMAYSAIPPAAVQGPPPAEQPLVGSTGFSLLVAVLGVTVPPAQPSASASASPKAEQAIVAGEYPLLQTVLATEG